jgi:hypothetical protein
LTGQRNRRRPYLGEQKRRTNIDAASGGRQWFSAAPPMRRTAGPQGTSPIGTMLPARRSFFNANGVRTDRRHKIKEFPWIPEQKLTM